MFFKVIVARRPMKYNIKKSPNSITRIKPKYDTVKLKKTRKPRKTRYKITSNPTSITKIKPSYNNSVKLFKPKKQVKKTTPKKIKKTKVKIKRKRVYHGRVDQSLPSCNKLLQMGYDRITFEARNSACPICQDLNGSTWNLKSWLNQLKHKAPIFEISHVQCLDDVKIWDSEGILPDAYVNWTGRIIYD